MSRDLQRHMARMALGRDDLRKLDEPEQSGFAVHRNNVQGSLTDVLGTAFPAVKRVLGDARFNDIAGRFIAAHPPRAPQLSAYGDAFPAFIVRQDASPYLSDLARLEWARAESYFAGDAPPLDTRRLLTAEPSDIERMKLTLHPATRLVTSAFSIFSIWRGDIGGIDKPQCVLVSRKGYHIVTREIGAADAAFITALASGATLMEAATSAQIPESGLQEILQAHFINATFQDA